MELGFKADTSLAGNFRALSGFNVSGVRVWRVGGARDIKVSLVLVPSRWCPFTASDKSRL